MEESVSTVKIMRDKVKQELSARNTVNHGVTLVAFYGDNKPPTFAKQIREIITNIPSQLSPWLKVLPLHQIHGTLIGMEGTRTRDGAVLSENIVAQRAREHTNTPMPPINFEGLLSYLQTLPWPIRIQFGGYTPDDLNPHDPARSPFERSLAMQENGLLTLIGWPVGHNGTVFAPLLAGVRKGLEKYGVVHKYHVTPGSIDNDLFAVIATIDYGRWLRATEQDREYALREMGRYIRVAREDLSTRAFLVDLDPDHLFFVKYTSPSLETTTYCQPINKVTPHEVQQLYE